MRIAAVEHPRLSPDDDFSQRSFGPRVVQRQLAGLEYTPELDFLVGRVAERLGREIAAGGDRLGRVHPREEIVDERSHILIAERRALWRGRALRHAISGVDRPDSQQSL